MSLNNWNLFQRVFFVKFYYPRFFSSFNSLTIWRRILISFLHKYNMGRARLWVMRLEKELGGKGGDGGFYYKSWQIVKRIRCSFDLHALKVRFGILRSIIYKAYLILRLFMHGCCYHSRLPQNMQIHVEHFVLKYKNFLP